MSGIFGIVRSPGAMVTEAELAQMADALKHRGPDGIRYSAKENVGLGHCMLQSTPESLHEVLPYRDDASGLTITADARIDNREQLVSDIPLKPSIRHVISDSDLILRAYIKWGEACVDHLLGDFAFAIWNEQTQALFVARDHMGCKPFYYHCREGLFIFASSAMAVACIPAVMATLNEGRVADYLVQELEGINNTCTWYHGVSRMPPAHCGYYRKNRFQARLYWVLEPADLSHLNSDEDYLEAFTEVYTEAVRVRLRCQTEPGSMLSGGLDSSTIVALARDILVTDNKPPLRTYSGNSENFLTCPETQSVRAVVSHGGIVSRCLRPSDVDNHEDALTTAIGAIEDPFDGSWTLLALLFLVAAQDGGRVLLSGHDGEHAVGAPTNYIRYMLAQGQWCAAWNEAKGFSKHYWRGHHSATRLYLRALRSYLAPDLMRKIKHRLVRPWQYRRLFKDHLIAPAFSRRVNLQSRFRENSDNEMLKSQASLQEWHIHVMQIPHSAAALERYERLASYFGVETRHPLMDIRLLKFSAALPIRQKVRGGWSKFMLRRLASERLPQSVAWRKGWEELGWKFTSRRARNFTNSPGFPKEVMRRSLAQYVEERRLERCQKDSEEDEFQLGEFWLYYILFLWLTN